jgi:hypothetical protein
VASQELYRWPTHADVQFRLLLLNGDGTAATGKSPTIQIRRERENYGTDLDLYWWDGAGFVATQQQLVMTEWDVTNHPGWYRYGFAQSTVGLNHTYLVFYEHTVDPIGSAPETHIFTDEVFITAGQSDPIVVTNQTVLGNQEIMKDGGTGLFDPTTDSLHALGLSALRLAGLSRENSIYDQIVHDSFSQPVAGRLRVFDSASNVPAAPGGSETLGLLHEYAIQASYASQGILTSFVLKRIT